MASVLGDFWRILDMTKTYGKRSHKTKNPLRFPRRESPAASLDKALSSLSLEEPVTWEPRERTIQNFPAAFLESKKCLDITKELSEILRSIKKERGAVNVTTWHTALDSLSIEKIAEASYAQVYRATTQDGATSILKVMQLKLRSDPSSLKSEVAATLASVIPEIKITDELSEIEGFVDLKGVHILVGKPPKVILEAYERYSRLKEESLFPHPKTCTSKSAFLLLEEADAGIVLDDFQPSSTSEMEAVLMGVIKPLALAEQQCGFEHRDLHESNVCVSRSQGSDHAIRVTLLDYGLSYCGSIGCHRNLELDLDIFRGEAETGNELQELQFKTYRWMRHVVANGRPTSNIDLATELWPDSPFPAFWADNQPVTNVFWLNYILRYLMIAFRDQVKKTELTRFSKKFSELRRRLDPEFEKTDTFLSAYECLLYCIDKGWMDMTKEQETEIRALRGRHGPKTHLVNQVRSPAKPRRK